MNTPVQPSTTQQSTYLKAARKRMSQVAVVLLIQAVILFVAAGQLDWLAAWAYIAVYLVTVVINGLVIMARNPGLMEERSRIADKNTKSWDKVVSTAMGIFYPILTLLVAGLDERFGWSRQMPLGLQVAGAVFLALSTFLFGWAMASNQFFAQTVRIATERGHRVAAGGPYQVVRHPGYIAYAVMALASACLLGSFWALIPACLSIVALIVRTALEDRTLQAELPGYREYANQVRYRLLPGVW
jgi:protein-S-isoprenylcysteine O-methyltransferase Ste14